MKGGEDGLAALTFPFLHDRLITRILFDLSHSTALKLAASRDRGRRPQFKISVIGKSQVHMHAVGVVGLRHHHSLNGLADDVLDYVLHILRVKPTTETQRHGGKKGKANQVTARDAKGATEKHKVLQAYERHEESWRSLHGLQDDAQELFGFGVG